MPDWRTMSQRELDEHFHWGHTAPATPAPPKKESIRITYEVSGSEAIHPDLDVVLRMEEIGISNCGYGCKVYADPRSNLRVLSHNSAYGCPK